MTLVSKAKTTKRAIWRPALWLVFIAQLVLVLTPLIEGREGPDARAHVEEAGTRIHHAQWLSLDHLFGIRERFAAIGA